MGYNNILGCRGRRYIDCPNRNPRFDTRGPYDRGLSPGRDRYDGQRRRYDWDNWDDRRNRRGICCPGRRRGSTNYRRGISDYRY